MIRRFLALLFSLWLTYLPVAAQQVLGGYNDISTPQRPPTPSIGLEGNWYIDFLTGNVFGPKTQGHWPQVPITSGNVTAGGNNNFTGANTHSGPETFNGPITLPASSFASPGIAPHVPTNSALTNTTMAAFPGGVWRDDYATGNGAPPLFFAWEIGTCSFNGLVSDGGSCQNTTDGNSLAAKFGPSADFREWGAAFGGQADAALANAIAYACLTHKPISVPQPPSQTLAFKISTSLVIGNGTASTFSTCNGISLFVDPPIQDYSNGLSVPLTWNGANNSTVFTIQGPIQGVKIEGLGVECSFSCSTAYKIVNAVNSDFGWIGVRDNNNGPAFDLSTIENNSLGVANEGNRYHDLQDDTPGAGGSGILVGHSTCSACNVDVIANQFDNITMAWDPTTTGTYAFKFGLASQNTFTNARALPQVNQKGPANITGGSMSGNTLTVTSINSNNNPISVGNTLYCYGCTGFSGSPTITAVLSGSGGVGTYTFSGAAQSVASISNMWAISGYALETSPPSGNSSFPEDNTFVHALFTGPVQDPGSGWTETSGYNFVSWSTANENYQGTPSFPVSALNLLAFTGSDDRGSVFAAKTFYAPTVTFVGGTTPTAASTGGYYQSFGSFVCATFFSQISYAVAPTGVNFTLPFASTNSAQFLGTNGSTGLPLYGAANSSENVTMTSFSGSMFSASGQFISATACYTRN